MATCRYVVVDYWKNWENMVFDREYPCARERRGCEPIPADEIELSTYIKGEAVGLAMDKRVQRCVLHEIVEDNKARYRLVFKSPACP